MIRPKPLAIAIVPPRLTYYGEDPTPPPAGGDPGSPGGGGGDPNAAIIDFRAPDIGDIGDILSGKKDGDPSAVPPAPKPGDGKPPVKKEPPAAPPAPKPGDPPKPGTPPAEPPVKQLRDELEAVKKERDELKGTLEKGDPRLKAAEEAVKAKETEISEAKTKLAEYERKLAMADPAVTKELQEKDSAYDGTARKFYASVPELTGDQVHSFVRDFNALPFGKPEYKEARAAFEAKVNAALGGDDEREHRKLEKALGFIEQTHEYAVERPKLVSKIEGSALKLQAEAKVQKYTSKAASVRETLEAAKKIPDGLAQTDPFHPKIMLDLFSKNFAPEQLAEFEKGIPEFVELVAAGIKPRGEQDYAGMTPAQIAESQANESAKLESARKLSIDVMYNGLRALRLFPALVKDWQRLNAKVKEDGDGTPPDPTGGNGGDPNNAGDPNDLKNFKAPNLDSLTF